MHRLVVRQTNPNARTLITVSEITIALLQLHLYRAKILGSYIHSPTQPPKIQSTPSLSLDKSFYITAVFQVSMWSPVALTSAPLNVFFFRLQVDCVRA